ncbi:MAG: TetR/AcrR family transcriptional regulator [Actinomycetota bacterium]
MGHKHTRSEILDGALALAIDDGLSQLTFGRVAKRLDISDRIVVYYFPTKDDLISEVILAMGNQLQEALVPAFTETAADHVELVRTAWPLLARPEVDPTFALFFEANGLATAGREPYTSLVPTLVTLWVDWVMTLVEGSEEHRRTEAEATIALLDGLLLLRLLIGADAADRAAKRLGFAEPG